MPFLKNTWYVFGYDEEITADAFAHRVIADEPILVYRRKDGKLAALRDLCPHRFVPLHLGKQVGDAIQCGYHGLHFGPEGRCVKSPVPATPIPKAAFVRAFPVVERYSLVWVWLGEVEAADPDLIPDFAFLADPARGNVRGYTHVKADYQLDIDNLSDLTHIQYVHASSQETEAFERLKFRTEQVGETVYTYLDFPNGRPPVGMRNAIADPEMPIDLRFETRWNIPSCVRLRITGTRPGQGEEQLFETMSAHIVSPETGRTTHYFYVHSRTFAIDDRQIDEDVRTWQKRGFEEEDKPMLEAQQRCIRDQDIMTLGPVLLPTDAGAIRVRRVLAARMKAEGLPSAPAERTL